MPESESGAGAAVSATAVSYRARTGHRLRRVRRYARGLDQAGVAIGLLFFVMSLTPSLLPRPWQLQGLVSGIATAGGYALARISTQEVRHKVQASS